MSTALPPGWSAKYDVGQRRYFFINHNTKTTTWEDPRYARKTNYHVSQANPIYSGAGSSAPSQHYPATSQTPHTHYQYPVNPYNVRQSIGSDEQQISSELGNVKSLKSSFPNETEEHIRELLRKHNNNIALVTGELEANNRDIPRVIEPNKFLLKKLAKELNAPEDIIISVLQGCKNMEADTRHQLISMGYKPTPTTTISSLASSQDSSGNHQSSMSTSPSSPAKVSTAEYHISRPTPGKTTPATSPIKTPSKSPTPQTSHVAEPKLSEADKEEIREQLSADFPSTSSMVVEMVLETVSYDEANARGVLRTMGQEIKGQRPPKKSENSVTPSKKASNKVSQSSKSEEKKDEILQSLSQSFPHISRSLIKMALETCKYNEARARTLLLKDSSHSDPVSPRKSTPSPPKETTFDSSTLIVKQETPANKENEPIILTPKESNIRRPSKVTEKPVNQRQSRTKSVANGPNPVLRSGPDATILLENYVQPLGPNPVYRKGPQVNVKGSQGALGHNVSLVVGVRN